MTSDESRRLRQLESENARLTSLVAALVRENEALRGNGGMLDGPAGLRVRAAGHQVWVGETAVTLTPTEFATLRALLERRGEVVTADVLAVATESADILSTRQVVETHISRLRRKLRWAGAGNIIRTVRGVGYTIR